MPATVCACPFRVRAFVLALAAARQVLAVPFAAVALDFLEAGDVPAFDTAERPFDQVVLVEDDRDFRDFLVVERIRPRRGSMWSLSHTSRAVVGPIPRMYRRRCEAASSAECRRLGYEA